MNLAGREGVLGIALYLLIKDLLFPKVKNSAFYQNKMRKGNNGTATQRIKLANPYPPPGKGDECLKHLEKIGKLETKIDMFMDACKEDFNRIRGNIKDLFDKYDTVKKR